MKLPLIFAFAMLLSLNRCGVGTFRNADNETVVARVGDTYLYLEDLKAQMPEHYKAADSSQLSQAIVNQWVQEQLLIQQAEDQLPDSLQDFEKQLNVYRNSLLIHTFKQKWIALHLDTVVDAQDIEEFYLSHQKEFLLKQNIIRFAYVKVPIMDVALDSISYLVQNITDTTIDRMRLESICAQRGYDNFLNTEQWTALDKVARRIPLEMYNQETFLKNNHFIRIKDYPFWHIIHITDFKITEDISPLEFERGRIKNIIIQQRENQLLKKLSSDIYNNAINNNQLEFY